MDIEVNGPGILFEIPLPGGIQITESIVNMWLLMAAIALVSLMLTRGMRTQNPCRRQVIAETIVKTVQELAYKNAGAGNMQRCAFAAAIFAVALFSGLMGLAGMFAPSADLSTCIGWALTVFAEITLTRIRRRKLSGYIRSFAEPYGFMTPINIISEISLPLSMAFRMFGNIASGAVVMLLIYAALASLGSPVFQIGIPAVFSIYFDVFASALQAFIFTMLAMIYIRLAGE